MIREREYAALPGLLVTLLLLAVLAITVYFLISGAERASAGRMVGLSLVMLLELFLFAGLFVVNPNEGKLLQFFGDYVGTVKTPGLRWANPLYSKSRVSLRVRNFERAELEGHDHGGH